MEENQIEWAGAGRWLSFAGSALLVLSGIPAILGSSGGITAGWNIFLGLLLFGSVASGSKFAPKAAIIVAALMLLRSVLIPVLGGGVGPCSLLSGSLVWSDTPPWTCGDRPGPPEIGDA